MITAAGFQTRLWFTDNTSPPAHSQLRGVLGDALGQRVQAAVAAAHHSV